MQAFSASRRQFFRRSPKTPMFQVRPPGAQPDNLFLDRCNRCGDCVPSCPTHIIVLGDGGYPTLDFSQGECTFCRKCAHVCTEDAITTGSIDDPWLWAAIGPGCLANANVECRICGESCPEAAIRFRPRIGGIAQPEFVATHCSGCGACVAPCPTHAITMEIAHANR